MKSVFTKEAKIGLVTIVSLALLYLGINYLKGINLFQPVNHYYVSFSNVKGVTISSPVFVDGFKVGLVRDIIYDYDTTGKIIVEVSLEDKMRLNKGSYIAVVNTFLSGAELHIHLNTYVDDFLKPGSTLEGRMEEDMMQSVQEKILPSVENLLPKIDTILGSLQTLIAHPALAQSLNHIEKTTSNLEVSTRQLNQMLSKDVPGIVNNLKTMTDNFSEVSANLKELDLATTVNSINATLANLKLTTDKLNSTDNSIGLLLNDKGLYDNLNSTMDNASKELKDQWMESTAPKAELSMENIVDGTAKTETASTSVAAGQGKNAAWENLDKSVDTSMLEKAFDWGASDIKPTLPQELSGPAPTVDSYNFGQAPANAPMADPNAPTLADLMREINALKQQVEAQKVASVSKTGAGRFAPRSHVNKTRISRV